MQHGSKRALAAIAAIACLTSACPDPGGGGPDGGGTGGGSWTVLVYMVADNNLEPFGVKDLLEMAGAGATDKVKFVIQADRAVGYSAEPAGGLDNWTSTKRIVIRSGQLEQVADLGELNMGDPAVLSDFVSWGIRTYPADRYMMVFWDHGSGWPGFGGDDSAAGHDLLNLAELKSGLQAGLAGTSVPKFEIIGFDACLMATFEVALTMRPFANYLLASEELEPGVGWDYRTFSTLARTPSQSPAQLATTIIDGFIAHTAEVNQEDNVTLSFTNLGAPLSQLETAVTALANEAKNGITASTNVPTVIARKRMETLKFGEMPDPSTSTHNVDLGDLAAKLAAGDGRFSAALTQIQAALGQAIVYKRAGPVAAAATGLSIYFPPAVGANGRGFYKSSYDSVQEAASWRSFLTAYFSAAAGGTGSGGIPAFTNPGNVGTTFFQRNASDGNNWWFGIEGNLGAGTYTSVATATVTYGFRSTVANTWYLVGEQPALYDSSRAQGVWDLRVLTLAQGTKRGYGYLSVSRNSSGGRTVNIPFAYLESPTSPSQYCIRVIVLDAAGNVQQDSYYVQSAGGWGQLNPIPGSQLHSLVQLLDSTGIRWVFGSDPADPFNPTQLSTLQFGFGRVLQGVTVIGVLTVADFGGDGDFVTAEGIVPAP